MYENSNKKAAFIKLQGATEKFIKLSVYSMNVCLIKIVYNVNTVQQCNQRHTSKYNTQCVRRERGISG